MSKRKRKNESFVPDEPRLPEIPEKKEEPPFKEPYEPEIFPEENPIISVPERSDTSPPEID